MYGECTSDSDRREVAALLGALHSSDAGKVPEARHDDFAIPNREELIRAIDEVGRPWGSGPFAERSRRVLSARASEIGSLLQRYDELVTGARDVPDHVAITHGEPHAANTIVTATGRVLIDWDTALVAPPERDLWMMAATSSACSAASTTSFRLGGGFSAADGARASSPSACGTEMPAISAGS